MPAPAVGTVVDGYRFRGGDPNSQSSWELVGKAGGVYADTLARERAKNDVKRLEGAMEGYRNAFGNEATADRALSLLNDDTPTGPAADARINMGKTVGGMLGFLPGIPTREQAQNLEQLRNIQSQGALGDVGQLKGPLSEKELAFVQRMQVDPNATQATNRAVLEAQKWVSRRQAAYGAALERWTRNTGSPSATNKDGLTFDRWWAQYSSRNLPPPWSGGRPAGRITDTAPRTSSGGDYKIIAVE